jgi:hypothetical protein
MRFPAFLAPPMARDKNKKVVLRPVEERSKPAVVIRLGPEKELEDTTPPVRLGPVKKTSDVILNADADPKVSRTHQPDIDDLIDSAVVAVEDTEQTWGEEARIRRNRPWGWLILLGLILTGGITWSLLSVQQSDDVANTIRMQTEEIIVDEATEQKEAEELVSNIESAIRAYFSATSLESRLRWVRFPERVAPMMRQHEIANPVRPSPLRTIRLLQPLPIERHTQFWMSSVILATGERRELVIECTDAGPRIDWETMVCYQPMPWDEFARKRPQGTPMEFRVHVQPDTFYSHEFSNENEWACYRLSALDADAVIFGYVRRGSDMEAEIAALAGGIRHASLVLRLQIPTGIQSTMGVVIDKIISPRWLLITLPDEAD